MKKTVLTYGLISGVIGAVLMLAHVPFMDGGSKALIVGYAGIVLSALVIFFGVRSYREKVGNGKISFGRGFAVGILIALISAACYVAAWEVVYYRSPGIVDHMFDKQVEDLKAAGAPQEKIDETAREIESFKLAVDGARRDTESAATEAPTLDGAAESSNHESPIPSQMARSRRDHMACLLHRPRDSSRHSAA